MEYVQRDCQAPEYGEPFPERKNGGSSGEVASVEESAFAESRQSLEGTGNIVIRRVLDDDEEPKKGEEDGNTAFKGFAASKPSPPLKTTETTAPPIKMTSMDMRRQRNMQQSLQSSLNRSGDLLNQLARREHAPGVRQTGCPCCDPDNPSNVVDQIMML